jgi:hypothetical protein
LDISQATAQPPPARISPAKGRKGFLQYSRVKIQKHEIFPSRIECSWSKFPLLFYFPRFLYFLGSKANLILKLSMDAERTVVCIILLFILCQRHSLHNEGDNKFAMHRRSLFNRHKRMPLHALISSFFSENNVFSKRYRFFLPNRRFGRKKM